jgi:hypothetical protein
MATMALAAGAEGSVSTDQLIYKGASVKTQVDVNGAAAIALVGNALDAIAAQVEEQAKSGKAGEGPMAMLPMVAPMIGPAKDVIKSLERITVLVMAPKGKVQTDQFVAYYSNLMGARGWSPFIAVKDQDGTGVAALLAPEAKGVFLAVNNKSEMIVALITTSKPMGELIGQVASASGGAWPALISSMGKGKPAPKAEAAKEEKASEATDSDGK